ncbi:MAG TPA: N-acetylmuramoyl-L-alanine amidase [Candidatus Saccharimonadales bacterium]
MKPAIYYLNDKFGFSQSLKIVSFVIVAFVGCLLPTAIAVADASFDTYCITVGDCALYDPNSCIAPGSTANTSSPASSSSASGPTIVLDPGHSGHDIHDTDPQTGLYDHDYPNIPEISEVFSVAQNVKTKLQADGYNVIMTKNSVNDDVSFRQRADIANQANAALAVSIHDSHDTSWDDMGGGDGGQVYTQNVGDYRQNKPGMGQGNQKVTFTDNAVAQKSNQYGQTFAQVRTNDEGHKVSVAPESFDSRAGLPSGNLPMVQLFAKVPWVYNEVGAPSGPLSQSELDKYAKGIIDGVENSVPISGANSSSSTSSSGSSSGCCPSASDGVSADTNGAGSGVWNSGLAAPYIVEQYAINVLEDLAQKKGHPATDAVTQQHVLALVAWALVEGGDINNDSLFNLYNTGYSSPELDAGAHTANGLGSYKSFDAGVEATARTLASGHGGMANVLMDPSSTATDFAHAESYSGTSSYPGTQEWAGAALSDPSGYENGTWKPVLEIVKSNYKTNAALVIGTTDHELIDNKTDATKLSTINSSGLTSSSSGDCTGSTQGAGAIVQEALKLAWPDGSHGNTPKPEYAAALQQYNAGNYTGNVGNDCGVFVSTVIRASGVDPNYPQSGTGAQWSYVVAHPEKYDVQYNVTSFSDLQPGDILIVGGPGGSNAAGHTWIYVGKQPGPQGFYSASASQGSRTGNLDTDLLSDGNASGGYMRVRVK